MQLRCCLCRVRGCSDLIKNILICVPKKNGCLMGVEGCEGGVINYIILILV